MCLRTADERRRFESGNTQEPPPQSKQARSNQRRREREFHFNRLRRLPPTHEAIKPQAPAATQLKLPSPQNRSSTQHGVYQPPRGKRTESRTASPSPSQASVGLPVKGGKREEEGL